MTSKLPIAAPVPMTLTHLDPDKFQGCRIVFMNWPVGQSSSSVATSVQFFSIHIRRSIPTLLLCFLFFVSTFILSSSSPSFPDRGLDRPARCFVVGTSFRYTVFDSSLVPLGQPKSFCGQSLLILLPLWAIQPSHSLGTGVLGTIVLSADGIPIRTTFDSATTVQVNTRSLVTSILPEL